MSGAIPQRTNKRGQHEKQIIKSRKMLICS